VIGAVISNFAFTFNLYRYTEDMLVCYAGGGCSDVLGATSEELLQTSLFDGGAVQVEFSLPIAGKRLVSNS
jgi:hypothetical protein